MNERFSRTIAISYAVVFAAILLAVWLHFSTFLLTVLFSSFALHALHFKKKRWLAVLLFLVLLSVVLTALGFFVHRAIRELPEIADSRIPMLVDFANKRGVELPFTDLPSLMEAAKTTVRDTVSFLGGFAKIATKETVLVLVGVVISIGIFLNRDLQTGAVEHGNFYKFYYGMIVRRFRAFFHSFETVMGAQFLISLVNTVATSAFVMATSLPYPGLVIPLTFLCGLLPIVGNILSNTLIVGIAFGISPHMALWSLGFLVFIHKMEYFLNSKVIGSRIRHPMWLTLIGLIVGESLMGIPGLILAPVILHYLKNEGSQFAAPCPVVEPVPTGRSEG